MVPHILLSTRLYTSSRYWISGERLFYFIVRFVAQRHKALAREHEAGNSMPTWAFCSVALDKGTLRQFALLGSLKFTVPTVLVASKRVSHNITARVFKRPDNKNITQYCHAVIL